MDDRFTALSEELRFRILSLLEVEDLCRFMFVSKRCKLLCVSVPSLTIDNRMYTQDLNSRQRFNRIVAKYMFLRSESGTKMQFCSFVWSFRGRRPDLDKKRKNRDSSFISEEDRVGQWLVELSRIGTERFSISMIPREGRSNIFPCTALDFSTAKDLSFFANNYDLLFPRSIGTYRGLQSLKLYSAVISGDFDGVSMIGSLKSLCLYDCNGLKSILIRSSSLKVLEIINEKPVDLCHLQISAINLEKILLTWYPSDFMRTSFKFTCSALQEFVWKGYPTKFFDFSGSWGNLQCAALFLRLPPGSRFASFSGHDVQYVLPIFEKSAKLLRLHAETIEILFKLDRLTTKLDAMRNLAIDYCLLTNKQVPIIAIFLEKISCLETFCLTSSSANVRNDSTWTDKKLKVAAPSQDFVFTVKYWETQKLKFIDQLRKATVEVHGEWGNGVEFVKYLLKHARDLEYLTIICATPLASSIQVQLTARMKEAYRLTVHINEAFTKLTFCLKP